MVLQAVLAMPRTAEVALLGAVILSMAVPMGGFATIVVVVRVAARTLGTAERIAFFRGARVFLSACGRLAVLPAILDRAILVSGAPSRREEEMGTEGRSGGQCFLMVLRRPVRRYQPAQPFPAVQLVKAAGQPGQAL
jgi:hypothetical protein